MTRWIICCLVLLLQISCSMRTDAERWAARDIVITNQLSGCEASLRGVCAVSDSVAWASGSVGTVLRTTDGGASWQRMAVPAAEELDFRDVEAFSVREALLLTAGQPARVYRTTDGGATWSIVHESPHDAAFFDAMAFWNRKRGIAFSDPVDGHLLVITSVDGGATWEEVPHEGMPPVLENEAGFAASGTCLAVAGGGSVWIGLGGQTDADARVFHSTDHGSSWRVTGTPMQAGAAAGIFSIAFDSTGRRGVAVGGIYNDVDVVERHIAITDNGGESWRLVRDQPTRGYRSAVAVVPGTRDRVMIATGPAATDISFDRGGTWQALTDEGWHAVSFARDGSPVGWLSGADGRLARIELGQ